MNVLSPLTKIEDAAGPAPRCDPSHARHPGPANARLGNAREELGAPRMVRPPALFAAARGPLQRVRRVRSDQASDGIPASITICGSESAGMSWRSSISRSSISKRALRRRRGATRWRHPVRCVRPDLFIPLAEDTGLIGPLTEWVLRRVLLEQEPLLRRFPDLRVSINCPTSACLQEGSSRSWPGHGRAASRLQSRV